MMALLSTPAHALMDLMGLCVVTISMTAHQPCALTMLHAWIRLLITPVTAALVSLVDTARYPLITVLIRAVTTVARVLMNEATDGVFARQGSMAPVVK